MPLDKFYQSFNAVAEKHLTDCDVVLGADTVDNRVELRGMFDIASYIAQETEGRRPVLTIPSQKVGVLVHSRKLAIKRDGADEDDPELERGWMAYEVIEKNPDGKGMTLLHLHSLGKSCIGRNQGGFPYVFPIVFGEAAEDCVNIDDG